MFNHKLPTDFPMQTLRKKTSPCKYKNEPSRFLGDGVSFRAKLIGVLEVAEARGDRMCQEALADLKMAVRAAGEHKQRIQVHVAIDGLRLRDDKTGDSLYHHPVHKISFIAQDMTDSRAFGYIFGSPDTGHRFFGIKTDKAASQVVIAMRDLFQVVFELKKKEIELAKQQLEGKSISGSARHATCLAADAHKAKSSTQTEPSALKASDASSVGAASRGEEAGAGAAGGVAELVDLEQELCSLRRGLTQVEGLTPSSTNADPFGDSFTPPASAHPDNKKGLLPPPPTGTTGRSRAAASAASTPRSAHNSSPARASNTSALGFDLTAVTSARHNVDITNSAPASFTEKAPADVVPIQNSTTNPSSSLAFDVFTELDPLGTGRSKPYVDKKHFFQELKNPPKKVLKDLVTTTGSVSLLSEILPTVVATAADVKTEPTFTSTTITSVGRQSGGSVSIVNPPPMPQMFSGSLFTSDPFAETDPFDSADPFTDCFKEDPFNNANEFSVASFSRMEEFRRKLSRESTQESKEEKPPSYSETTKNIFNGPLQVSLPPEPAPKSPRMQRQMTAEAKQSTIRQRPTASGKLSADGASPPPPLPPKKVEAAGKPPPRPPHSDAEVADSGAESGPAIPRPARRKEPYPDRSMKPRLSSVTTNSSEDEYLSPVPPPLPGGARGPRPRPTASVPAGTSGLDMTLSQLLTCGLDELAVRLSVPASRLDTMTLAQLTAYLKDYLMSKSSTAETTKAEPPKPVEAEKLTNKVGTAAKLEFKTNFEDSFTGLAGNNYTFVANFDDFDKKVDPSYDRYAAFRDIQEEELKNKSRLDPASDELNNEEPEGSDTKEDNEVQSLDELLKENGQRNLPKPLENRSPLKSLDELTIDSLSALYATSISPKPMEIDSKIEGIKSVMKNLSIHSDQPKRSVTPKENNMAQDTKRDDKVSDRYAALREISIIEPQDEFESLPPEPPKERKKSDEKSDGFDNSDFFDCIDNSSLSFSHVDDAFRKSPIVKDSTEKDGSKETKVELKRLKVEEKTVSLSPGALSPSLPPARLSAGSLSDIVSGSSPEAGLKEKSPCRKHPEVRSGPAWTVFPPRSPHSEEGASPWSSDSKDSEGPRDKWEGEPRESPPEIPRPRRRQQGKSWHTRQTSSSSRDVSPWEEELPPTRHHRTSAHSRDSRHNSSGSRECPDSGSGRDKDKLRDKREPARERDRELSRDRRDSGTRDRERDRRDSGSGRDRREISKDRDIRSRDKRSREREKDSWEREREREYSRERDYRDGKSRERGKDRERHRRQHHSWDDDEDFSDGDGSGVSTPGHERWSDHRAWRRDERSYGSLGWRQPRRRGDARLSGGDESADRDARRYGVTLACSGRRSATARPRECEPRRRSARRDPPPPHPREPPHPRDPPHPHPHPPHTRHRRTDRFRFSNDFSEHDSPRDQSSPFENDFVETPSSAGPRKKGAYSSLEGARFAFEQEDEVTPSPQSAGKREPESPATRFRFDSDSVSPRSLFEDDFASESRPAARPPTSSIAEEDETGAEPLPREAETNGARSRCRPKPRTYHQDIKKSESVNIFVRDTDPFDGDDFFACTGSDRAARRENWPGDFPAFDGV